MKIAASLIGVALLTAVLLILTLFVTVAPTGRSAFDSAWPLLGGTIALLLCAALLVARHASSHPALWIYRSKVPAYLVLAVQLSFAAFLLKAIVG